MLSLYPSIVLIGFVAINGVILQSSPQSSPSSSAPSAINVSTTQSGVSPTQQPSVMSTSTGKPMTTLYPFSGVGYDLCNTGLTVSVEKAFIIGDILYFGDGIRFYRAIMSGNDWVYFNAENIHNIFADSNHFTKIINVIDFGSHNLCTQSQANCVIMTNAFDKTLVIGDTSASVRTLVLEYKTYITKDMGVGGHEILPIHPVMDPNVMPWGLPMSGPLTDPFWPQDSGVTFLSMAFDTKQQKLYITEMKSQILRNVYIRQMDGQLAGTYTKLELNTNVDSLLYRNGQMFALFNQVKGYRFYSLQFNNSMNRVFYSNPRPILEFINCRKNSSLVGPSAYPSDGGNSGPQNPSAVTIGGNTSNTTKKPNKPVFLTILIVVIVIVVIVAIICVIFFCLGSKKTPPKSADKKADRPTAGSAKTAPKSKVEPSGGAKGEDDKKSDETVRSA